MGQTNGSGRWGAVILSFLGIMMAMGFGRYAYGIILPNMQAGLQLNYGQMGILSAGNLTGYLIFAGLGGALASRWGSKIVICSSLAVMGLALIAIHSANSFVVALLLMIIAGMGTAGTYVPTLGLVSNWFTARQRGLGMAIANDGINVGVLAGAYLLPLVIVAYGINGWRFSWLYIGIGALVIAAIALFFLREAPDNQAAVGIVEKQGNFYRHPTIQGLALTYFLYGFFNVYIVFFMAYLTRGLGMEAKAAGGIWMWVGLVSACTVFLWGMLSDRIGRKGTLIPVVAIVGIASILPLVTTSLWALTLSAMLFGLSYSAPPTLIVAAVGDIVGRKAAPAAFGFVTMAFGAGQALGPALAGFWIDRVQQFYPAFLLTLLAMVLTIASITRLSLKGAATTEVTNGVKV